MIDEKKSQTAMDAQSSDKNWKKQNAEPKKDQSSAHVKENHEAPPVFTPKVVESEFSDSKKASQVGDPATKTNERTSSYQATSAQE